MLSGPFRLTFVFCIVILALSLTPFKVDAICVSFLNWITKKVKQLFKLKSRNPHLS